MKTKQNYEHSAWYVHYSINQHLCQTYPRVSLYVQAYLNRKLPVSPISVIHMEVL